MKIVWIIPTKKVVGGIRVVFEYANRLTDLGHEVICISPFEQFPYPPNWFRKIELLIREKLYYPLKLKRRRPFESRSEWFPLKAKLLEVPDLRAGYIPDADIVIATAWDTVEWVNTYPAGKGSKFYFIQHYEIWAGPKNRVDRTYKLPLKKITIASWLTQIMEQEFGEKVYATITNGINLEHFYNPHKTYNQPRRIGLLYHGTEWKGTLDGLKAFAIARAKFPAVKLVMFGVRREQKLPVPPEAEFHENPTQGKLRELYCSLDIFLSPSWTEGCQLPPMEAMACRCAVVATNVGGIPDYAIAGQTALVSPPRDPEALAANLIALLADETKLKQISQTGYEHIKEFSWDKAVKRLAETLVTAANTP